VFVSDLDLDVRPPQPLTARRAQTREKLMAAAVSVFAARGIQAASVEEICEAASFTRGAFYSNFADKNALVLALLQREMRGQLAAAEHAIAVLNATAAEGAAAETVVSNALAALEEFDASGRQGILTRQELLLYAARERAVRGPYRAFSEECLNQFAGLIRGAVATAGLEFTVDFADALALLSATHGQIQMEALFGDAEPDWRTLKVLTLAITRPRTDPPPGSGGTLNPCTSSSSTMTRRSATP